MDETTAKDLARSVIRPCGLLGYLIGRGNWWPNDASLRLGKRSVGQIMGSAYVLLGPLWQLHPSLDPGRIPDALGLAEQSSSLKDTPADLRSLLGDLERAAHRAAVTLQEELPGSRAHLARAVAEVDARIDEVRRVLGDAESA